MAITPNNTLHGARAIFTMNGSIIAYASNAQWSANYQMSPINVLGNIETVQHLPTAYSVNLSVAQLRTVNTTLVSLGFAAKIGQTAAEHLQNVAGLSEITATIEDTQTGAIIALFTGVRVESYSTQVGVNGLMTQDVTFVVRRHSSEDEN